mgnify:FL=1
MTQISYSLKKIFAGAYPLFFFGALSSILFFACQLLLARNLSPKGFGLFSTAFVSITILAPLAVFGIQHVWLKKFAVEKEKGKRWVMPSLRLVVLNFSICLFLLLCWAFFGPHESNFKWILIGLSPLILGHISMELVSARFQAEEKYFAMAVWQGLPNTLRFFAVLFLIYFSIGELNIYSLVFFYSFIALVFSLVSLKFFKDLVKGSSFYRGNKEVILPKVSPVLNSLRSIKVLKEAWPFGLAAIFYLIYLQSDLIFLKYMVNNESAGIYSASYTFLLAIYLFPGIIYQKFLLPKFHRWSNFNQERFLEVYQAGNGLMLMLGIIFLVFLFPSVSYLVPLFFGEAYLQAIPLIKILIFCVPIRFLSCSVEMPLFTRDYMPTKTFIMGLVAFFNIALNIYLIPIYSFYGACISTLISEILLLLFYALAVKRDVFGKDTFRDWNRGFTISFWKDL